MGRVKELLAEFCEVVYPDDIEKQDKLMVDIMRANEVENSITSLPVLAPSTKFSVEAFRSNYEAGNPPHISLEEMWKVLRE